MRLLNPCFWAGLLMDASRIIYVLFSLRRKLYCTHSGISRTSQFHQSTQYQVLAWTIVSNSSGRYQGSLGFSSPFDLVNGSLVYFELTARLTHYFVFIKLKYDISLFLPVFSMPIKAFIYFLDVHLLLLQHLQYLGLHFSMTPIVY